jgi:hypothetical protein
MIVLVVDGQGGGVGKGIISELRNALGGDAELIAVGTKSIATAAMLKAGAKAAVTGENPVLYNAARADVILGPIGIIIPNAMLGEITPAMAAAVAGSGAQKILIPFSKCAVTVAGVENCTLDSYIKKAAAMALRVISGGQVVDRNHC